MADEAFINAVQSYNEVRPHKYFVILGEKFKALRSITVDVLILHFYSFFIFIHENVKNAAE